LIKTPSKQQQLILLKYYQSGNLNETIKLALSLTKNFPNHSFAWKALALSYEKKGKILKSLAANQKAKEINPQDADVHNNLGNVFEKLEKFEEAQNSYGQAILLKQNYTEAYYNLANLLNKLGRFDEAEKNYNQAIKFKPNFAEAFNNLANMLKELHRFDEAKKNYNQAIKFKPNFAEAFNNLANVLKDQGRFDEAEKNYNQAIKFKPNFAEAFNNLANVLKDQGRFDESLVNFKESLKIKPELVNAETEILFIEASIGDHSNFKNLDKKSSRLGISTKSVEPFPGLSWVDNPSQQLQRSINYAAEKFKKDPINLSIQPKVPPKRIKIAYISGDFYNFPTMHLLAGVLENHNRKSFEIYAFSYASRQNDEMRERIKLGVDHFINVNDLSSIEIAKLIQSNNIDISIDLNGYTKKSRSEIFQYRMSPIQINYLGYPSTMGVHFMDYIIADPVTIPDENRNFYSEKIIYMPHTYQANDNKRKIAKTNSKRADFNLPDKGFVFCCFNQIYKISPKEFNIWMRILRNVNNSVLWLIKSNKLVEQNFSKEAKRQGIDPSRIVFAEKLSHSEHLARHKHADLFIDTFNYNAHTTASDALWCGLPIVTKQGKQFSARVASSLLTACGLPELITKNEQEYEELIYELATNPKSLKTISLKLSENKKNKPLFNTKQYTNNFENGLQKAYDLYFNGERPKNIFLKDFKNYV
jgi:predicted O-linked N-acetylglucosamine transferase (SPINDLY family)